RCRVQGHGGLGYPAWPRVGGGERRTGGQNPRRTAKAVVQLMQSGSGVVYVEVLDAGRGSVSECVQALVVVARNDDRCPLIDDVVYELQFHGVEVLEFVNDQVL